ncbi:MAG TPA: hypothetical protein VM535_00715 [Candidatus Saccharimonadales bacterium]|nr:hypothetical protein [Candidatus Saccharimonadales bacterium]
MEQAIPQADGTVIRRVYPGEGAHPVDELYESDEALQMERVRERHAELWDKVKHPVKFISNRVLGGEPHAA